MGCAREGWREGERLKVCCSNKKKNGSDEFLVEKKSPLVMPPNYDELPIPTTSIGKEKNETNEMFEIRRS